MNCSRPAPEPVGLYDRFLPGQTWPHTWLNTAIAFCCAVEPSAVSAFLPPHSADADAVPMHRCRRCSVPALLSLPHADSVSAAIAVADSVVPNALPMLLSFTYPTFRLTASDSPATYAAAVDGSRMEGERTVNRFS